MIGYEGAPRFASAVRALTGDAEIVPPGVLLEGDAQPRDSWAFIKRERLWVVYQALGASVGNYDQFNLSGITDIVEELMGLWCDQIVHVGLAATSGFSAGNAATSLDSRGPPPSAKLFTKQAAAQLLGNNFFVIPANTIVSVRNGTLPPLISNNGRIVIEDAAVNLATNLTIWGRERVLRPEEKADV